MCGKEQESIQKNLLHIGIIIKRDRGVLGGSEAIKQIYISRRPARWRRR